MIYGNFLGREREYSLGWDWNWNENPYCGNENGNRNSFMGVAGNGNLKAFPADL